MLKKNGTTPDLRYKSGVSGDLVGFKRITSKGAPDKRFFTSSLSASKRKNGL